MLDDTACEDRRPGEVGRDLFGDISGGRVSVGGGGGGSTVVSGVI